MIEDDLVEALRDCRDFADKLAECSGFLLLLAEETDSMTAEGIAGGRDALMGWQRFRMSLTEIIREASCD